MDVDTVTLLDQPAGAAPPKAEESPRKIATGTPAQLKFIGFFGSQGSDAQSEESSSKKRKTFDDRAAEEAFRAAARGRCDGSTAPVDGVPCPFRQPFLLDLNATVAVWFWSRKDIWVF
ncbi:hypothetical protein C8J57DRAFT_1224342 [Mycena rebaudengoi]|nr:hypothetical protein C8J57DRAFT_1224342 [Mycena rebaudengoi]